MKLLTFKDNLVPMYKNLFVILLIFITLLTVSAQNVPAPELIKVSVDVATGYTHVYWIGNNDPSTTFYEVGRSTHIEDNKLQWNYFPCDLKDRSYVFEDDETDKYPVGYCVRACWDEKTASTDNQIDSTIFLSGFFDSCRASIYINWNEYNSWRGEIDYYGVYVSEDNGPWQLAQQLSDGITSAIISDVNENVDYRIFISAIRSNERRDSSSSNLIQINTNMAVLPDYLFGDNATLSTNGQEINFSVTDQGVLKKYFLLKSNDINGVYDTLTTYSHTKEFKYTDDADFLEGPYYYKMSGVNFCDVTMLESENIASTVVLRGSLTGDQVDLDWNDYETYNGQEINYLIERKYGDGEYLAISEINATNYTDNPKQVTDASNFSSRVYYRLIAMPGYINKYNNSGQSLSNEIYFDLPASVRFDFDAFIPGGDVNGNEKFGPTMDILPEKFWFRIFDANGYMVFESKDSSQSDWDGEINESKAREGVYAYILIYSAGSGNENIIKGNVTVAYP